MPSWKFLNPQDRASIRRREALEAKIDRWWQTFRTKTKDLDALFHQRSEWDLPGWMERHLQSIDPELMWEFGADPARHGHYLVITPESQKHLRPMVDTLLERAPKLKGWTFYPYRQPESLDVALQTVEARTGSTFPEARVRASVGDNRRIDLVFQSVDFTPDDDDARGKCFVTCESLLGEEVLDKWIGVIEVASRVKSGRLLPLERLKDTVDALIAGLMDQLPDQPCYTFPEDREWSCFELKPKEQKDYPAKQDMIAGVSMIPDVLAAYFNSSGFYSSSFSRCGERFCYLKIDGSGKDAEKMKFADREQMENALDKQLKPAKLGCVTGGGTGLRYSYIDLALTDVDRAAAIIQNTLRKGLIPKRCWLLFFDCEWQGEWIGMWEETPAPPQK